MYKAEENNTILFQNGIAKHTPDSNVRYNANLKLKFPFHFLSHFVEQKSETDYREQTVEASGQFQLISSCNSLRRIT